MIRINTFIFVPAPALGTPPMLWRPCRQPIIKPKNKPTETLIMLHYQLVQGCNNVIIVRKIITIINYFSDYNAYYTFSIYIFNNFIIFSISLGLLFYTNNMLQHASICTLRRTRPTCTQRQQVFLHQQ